MAKYIVFYFNGNQPQSPEAAKAHFERYRRWLNQLGEAVVSPMNPVKNTHTILPDGKTEQGSRHKLSGYTILEADSIEQAVDIVRTCPFLEIGGVLEVAELIEISG